MPNFGIANRVPGAAMSLRAILHLLLHLAVPALVAWLFFRDPAKSVGFKRAWLLLLLGWVIDLDHLLADPIYAPCLLYTSRCV